jgi:hypothetical protein
MLLAIDRVFPGADDDESRRTETNAGLQTWHFEYQNECGLDSDITRQMIIPEQSSSAY